MKVSFAVLLASLFSLSQAKAEPFIPFHLADVYYQWSEPVIDVGSAFTVVKHPGAGSYYYWSHFITFANSGQFGSGHERFAYMGLQTGIFESGAKDLAIFSVWNALEASGANCSRFGGEGVGYKCTLAMTIVPGKSYEFQARRLESTSTGDLWQARVRASASEDWKVIGTIRSPASSGAVVSSVLFYEYYGQVQSCLDLPPAKVVFSSLRNGGGQANAKLVGLYQDGKCGKQAKVVISGTEVEIATLPKHVPSISFFQPSRHLSLRGLLFWSDKVQFNPVSAPTPGVFRSGSLVPCER